MAPGSGRGCPWGGSPGPAACPQRVPVAARLPSLPAEAPARCARLLERPAAVGRTPRGGRERGTAEAPHRHRLGSAERVWGSATATTTSTAATSTTSTAAARTERTSAVLSKNCLPTQHRGSTGWGEETAPGSHPAPHASPPHRHMEIRAQPSVLASPHPHPRCSRGLCGIRGSQSHPRAAAPPLPPLTPPGSLISWRCTQHRCWSQNRVYFHRCDIYKKQHTLLWG